ncbi:MAG: hypothetical protein AAF357_14480 [Verrucomicrobiota bacterium]
MYHESEEPEFPNWWDVLDESTRSERDRFRMADEEAEREGVMLSPEDQETECRVSESSPPAYATRGYEREVVENVWNFAEIVHGNDPDLWRKDEWGNWIRRLDYGKRESEFGWEIFDPGIGRHSQGVFMMRPMQWGKFLEQHQVLG